jgi:large subunit ribosomal protein L21
MFAIIEIGGKQYRVRENDRIYVPRQDAEPEAKLTFDRVLLVSNDDAVQVGTPVVDGASVDATVLAQVKADKVLIFRKKRRKRFRVKRGHRQPYTQIRIDAVKA